MCVVTQASHGSQIARPRVAHYPITCADEVCAGWFTLRYYNAPMRRARPLNSPGKGSAMKIRFLLCHRPARSVSVTVTAAFYASNVIVPFLHNKNKVHLTTTAKPKLYKSSRILFLSYIKCRKHKKLIVEKNRGIDTGRYSSKHTQLTQCTRQRTPIVSQRLSNTDHYSQTLYFPRKNRANIS